RCGTATGTCAASAKRKRLAPPGAVPPQAASASATPKSQAREGRRAFISQRVPVPVAVDFAATDVVGGADQAVALHALDPLGGGVVAVNYLPQEPRSRSLLVL